jgi:hypothetical protein
MILVTVGNVHGNRVRGNERAREGEKDTCLMLLCVFGFGPTACQKIMGKLNHSFFQNKCGLAAISKVLHSIYAANSCYSSSHCLSLTFNLSRICPHAAAFPLSSLHLWGEKGFACAVTTAERNRKSLKEFILCLENLSTVLDTRAKVCIRTHTHSAYSAFSE